MRAKSACLFAYKWGRAVLLPRSVLRLLPQVFTSPPVRALFHLYSALSSHRPHLRAGLNVMERCGHWSVRTECFTNDSAVRVQYTDTHRVLCSQVQRVAQSVRSRRAQCLAAECDAGREGALRRATRTSCASHPLCSNAGMRRSNCRLDTLRV